MSLQTWVFLQAVVIIALLFIVFFFLTSDALSRSTREALAQRLLVAEHTARRLDLVLEQSLLQIERHVSPPLPSPEGPELSTSSLQRLYRQLPLLPAYVAVVDREGGVLPGGAFLRDLNLGKGVKLGERVAVIGGGNVAIDSARSALRLGAKEVFILYRRSREEMPASEWEVEAAEEEGVRIHYLAAPIAVLGKEGRVSALRCMRMRLGEPDASGRRRPIPLAGSEFEIGADTLIPAIGQGPDLAFIEGAVALSKGGVLEVSSSLATSRQGVFAGGDAVTGPATVVEAIAAGRRAAQSIDRYLSGQPVEVV